MLLRPLSVAVALFALAGPALAQPDAKADYTRTEDVIYGRRDGHALTLDVFTPKAKANGKGIIVCVSARFESSKELLDLVEWRVVPKFTERGYVVFAVLHSSAPKYSVPEIVEDMHRAVRFVKAGAKKYNVDPEKLGIAGASSGGCLSLMMSCGCRPGNPDAKDAVERQSSKVAAVACFFPVTDFPAFEKNPPPKEFGEYEDLFPFREFDPKANKFKPIDADRRREIGRACSPLHCATKDAAPTLIIHGDADEFVPIKQSKDLKAALDKCGAVCKLDIKKDMGHSMFEAFKHLPDLLDWFDKHLPGK